MMEQAGVSEIVDWRTSPAAISIPPHCTVMGKFRWKRLPEDEISKA